MRRLQLAWSPRAVFAQDGGGFQSQNSFVCRLFVLILNSIFASPEEGPLVNRMRLIFLRTIEEIFFPKSQSAFFFVAALAFDMPVTDEVSFNTSSFYMI